MRRTNKIKEGYRRSEIIKSLEESLPQDITEWFEGPNGLDNNPTMLKTVIDMYKEVLDSIEPYQIFADY